MCKKDDDHYHWGEATALLNGVEWHADPFAATAPAYPEGFVGIVAEIYSGENGFLREVYGFHKVPLKAGVYDLGRVINPHDYPHVATDYYTALDDGDVVGDIYLLDTLANNNYFEVLSYKESKKEIEVKFAATFLLDRKANTNAPDTLKFEDGYIKTRINN